MVLLNGENIGALTIKAGLARRPLKARQPLRRRDMFAG
jgi:hypothetical protein